jgi:hypothetical protein
MAWLSPIAGVVAALLQFLRELFARKRKESATNRAAPSEPDLDITIRIKTNRRAQ